MLRRMLILHRRKRTFTVSQVQYTRGMISKMAYTDALDTFTTAQETEVAARIDLLTAYNTYQWAKRGVITATTLISLTVFANIADMYNELEDPDEQ